MADKYLVPCSCGQSVPVAVNQAGSKVLCSCGSEVGVPPLRKLREFPRDTTVTVTQRSAWTPRHAIASAGAIIALGMAAWGVWQWATEPIVPDFEQHYEDQLEVMADEMLAHATPLQFYQHLEVTGPILIDRGFEEISTPQQAGIVEHVEDRQLRRKLTFAAAALVAAISAVVWFFWPKPQPSSLG
jgi:hypothetical protein